MKTALRLGALLFAGLTIAAPIGAVAGDLRASPKAVLELFTSQGCASCPPADALLKQLAANPDLITLAYHVDYWDYVGWPDTFGSEANSKRQRAYAARWGSGRIYTPQLVVNGMEGVVGSRQDEVDEALAKADLDLPVKLALDGDTLAIDIDGQAGLGDATVWLVSYVDVAPVTIERGENAGKQVDYTNVVTGRQMLGMWEAGAGTHLKLPVSEVFKSPANGAVVLVQQQKDGLPGKMLGAALIQQ